jgi:hypothetical protein
MMRALLCASVALAGCFAAPPTGYPPPPPSAPAPPVTPPPVVVGATWTLLHVSASVQDLGYGVAPDVYVTALVDGTQVQSQTVYGSFDAAWNEPLMNDDEAGFESGIDLQVWADYGGGPTLVGELTFAPVPTDFGSGPIDLGAFEDVNDLQVELQPG